MYARRGLLLAGLTVLSLGLAMLLSASTFAGPAPRPSDGPLTIVDIQAGCSAAGVVGTITVRNTSDESVSDTLPFLLMQHIPPARGGPSQFFPVPGGAFTISVTLEPGETAVLPFGPLSTTNVDPEANALRVDTDVATRPDLNPEKSESFPPCGGVTPTTRTATATATPVETFTSTPTATATRVKTETATSTMTPVPTATETEVATPTETATAVTPSPSATETKTAVPTDTSTPTSTAVTASPTTTNTSTPVPTDTSTPTSTAVTASPTATTSRTAVPTHTNTPTRTAVPTHSPTPTHTVIAGSPSPTATRVNITLPGTPPARPTPPFGLPPTGGPPSPGGIPTWWLLSGAMMSVAGAALVLKAVADGRAALPATLYVEISGLDGFSDFYETVAAMRARLSARATTAVSFLATQGRAEVRVDGLDGDARTLRDAAIGSHPRAARVRRQRRDRVRLDLD